MRQLLGIFVSFTLLAGASLLAVERLDDRELFVPPPDAVAEEFVRAVINGHYEPARSYLAEESSMPDDELRALQESLGDPSEIEAEVVSRDDTRALANVRVSGGGDSASVSFTLQFDQEWKIVR
jgi:hypothetical protein